MDEEVPTKGDSHSHACLSLSSKAADYRRIPNGVTNTGTGARGILIVSVVGVKEQE